LRGLKVTAYDTEGACEIDQRAAMAREELRVGPTPERRPDGLKVWDPDRQYDTTFRYLGWPVGAGTVPFR
jgi:hypothetical protein